MERRSMMSMKHFKMYGINGPPNAQTLCTLVRSDVPRNNFQMSVLETYVCKNKNGLN